jgi:two-component system cell cycle sensor histidine kinase/response regulator CckA
LQNAVRSDAVLGYLSNSGCRSIALSTRRPISGTVLDTLRTRFLKAIETHKGEFFQHCEIELAKADGYRDDMLPVNELESTMIAPVKVAGHLVGLLMIASQQRGAFGAEQARLINTFANQAATAAQRLAALLTAQQKHLESLVEHMPVGTVLLDEEFNLLVTNPLGLRILTTLNPEINDRIGDMLGPISFKELLEHQNDLMPVEITVEGTHRRVFEAQIRPVGEPSNQWVLTLREVTRERENQDRIQSQDRLATVGQLAAGIAHDFNNIMAAILVYADLLSDDPDIPKESREKLAIIEEQVHRAASLIRQILDFSRRSIMEQSTLDLLPFVKELDKMLGRVLPETISLELTYQPGQYWVNADPTRLQQVFMNLALNARDAMPDGGLLQFRLLRYELKDKQNPPIHGMTEGSWVQIRISDTGIGVSPEAMQHIFEPFFTTKPVGQGTGLGLAQVYGIIRHHEGYIDVESQPGRGTTFTIYLPSLDKPPAEPMILETSKEIIGKGETILVVEDDEITREAICALLKANEFEVLTAANGQHAYEIYCGKANQITLIISDVVMPVMGGVDLYTRLREDFADVRMLFITGHPLEGKYQQLLEHGNVHWLQKPFSVQVFNETIWSLLSDENRESDATAS